MKFSSFVEMVKEEVEKRLGEEYTVKTKEVIKNNGVVLTGITVGKPEINISPIIYLNNYYETYTSNNEELEKILSDIMEIYVGSCIKHTIDLQFFTDFEQVKEQIVFKLVNYEKNSKLLKDVPFLPFQDLAIVFQCLVSNERNGSTSIMIHHAHTKLWNVTAQDLYRQAQENMPRLYPYEICGIRDIVMEMMQQSGEETDLCEALPEEAPLPLYVLTNTNRINGAGTLLYENIIKDFAQAADKNVFILPSSVHEVLLLVENGGESVENLKQMVHEVNETEVEAEDFLSDHIYYYNRKTSRISMY